MSGSVNKVILIGRLGADPVIKCTQGGDLVANFSLATDESWKDEHGEKKERTEWHKIVAWGKPAELAEQYLAKGRQVYLEGKLQTRTWEAKDGNKRSTTEVVAGQIIFLGSKDEGDRDRESRPQGSRSRSNGRNPGGAQQAFEEDIPF